MCVGGWMYFVAVLVPIDFEVGPEALTRVGYLGLTLSSQSKSNLGVVVRLIVRFAVRVLPATNEANAWTDNERKQRNCFTDDD